MIGKGCYAATNIKRGHAVNISYTDLIDPTILFHRGRFIPGREFSDSQVDSRSLWSARIHGCGLCSSYALFEKNSVRLMVFFWILRN
jgi:hypothetical protein